MITADQLLCHAVGDYVLQSDWMATRKRTESIAAAVHAVFYSLPFALLRPSLAALAVIVGTHFLIDRFGLARYVVWAKNWIGPTRPPPWSDCSGTGYAPDRPLWLSLWLTIIADNVMHVAINGLALRFL